MLINFQNQSDSKILKFLFDGIFFLIPETEIIFIYLNLSLTRDVRRVPHSGFTSF